MKSVPKSASASASVKKKKTKMEEARKLDKEMINLLQRMDECRRDSDDDTHSVEIVETVTKPTTRRRSGAYGGW